MEIDIRVDMMFRISDLTKCKNALIRTLNCTSALPKEGSVYTFMNVQNFILATNRKANRDS